MSAAVSMMMGAATPLFAHLPAGLAAVHIRQVDVQQDQVGPAFLGRPRRPRRRSRLGGLELLVELELFGEGAAQVLVVVDDEQGLALSHGAEDAPYRRRSASTVGDVTA